MRPWCAAGVRVTGCSICCGLLSVLQDDPVNVQVIQTIWRVCKDAAQVLQWLGG
jgi:hypothetical protein